MLFVGLTGVRGAGKTTALEAFARAGAPTLSTDDVVHKLLLEPEIGRRLVERWGEGVRTDGIIDRHAVAGTVFDDPAELEWVERFLHPLVRERIAAWRADLEQTTPRPDLAVVEVPLLFEGEMEKNFDATVTVVADRKLRQTRTARRTEHGTDTRDARQLSQEEKARRADFTIENDGTPDDLTEAVAEVRRRLHRRGAQGDRHLY